MSPETIESRVDTLADFRPFSAWRYNLQKVKAADVIAPPYDVISPAGQDELYRRSAYNCIRLILNKIEETDTEANNRYTRARDCFSRWKKEDVLVRDEKPCFYLYRQSYKDPRDGSLQERSALLGALKLEPFENQVVIPHEKTLAKPRADRRKLLEATETNFSPIFGLFEDPKNEIVSMLPALSSGKPLFEVTDDGGVTHRLWAIQEEGTISRIRKSLSSQRVYIADGHHRYTTALEYAKEKRKAADGDGLQASDFVYMALVGFHDPGLVLLPTHRLLTGVQGFDGHTLVEKLGRFFDVEEVQAEKLMGRVEESSKKTPSLGLVFEGGSWLLALKDAAAARAVMPAGKPDVWYGLDVNLLAYLILKGILGLSETDWETHLKFTHSDPEALEMVGRDGVQAAFLLKAPPVQVLSDMGKVRELMPQKSTYFYPKLASGLLFFQHDAQSVRV